MSSSNYYTLIILIFIYGNYFINCVVIDYNNPIAQTAYGQVKGKQYTYSTTGSAARQAVAFIGVPYAKSPTGVNRFLAPQPPDAWAGEVKDCTNNRVMCPQVEQRFDYQLTQGITESEDCLHLNIYVPVSNNQFTQNMPVLVYFHGGEFKYGGKDFYRPDFLLENSMVGNNPGIIVVTVNYRLGVLGFLSTDDINQPGNNGIRDQVQALRWISENIGSFNGNAGNVTIMGHDAGAISVSMLVLNQDAWPYFSAAISTGGTVFTPWAFKDNPRQQAIDFATFFKCDLKTDRMVDCLRNQDLAALLAKSRDRDLDNNIQKYWFRPVVDRNVTVSAVLKDYPLNLYQDGRYKRCSYIVGFTKNEGSLEYYLQYDRLSNKRTIEEKIAFLIRPFLKDYASEDIIASAIKYQYFSRIQSKSALNSQFANSPTKPQINATSVNRSKRQTIQQQQPYQTGGVEQDQSRLLVELMGDFLYIAPSDYVARLHSSLGGKSWVYMFEYESIKSFGSIQKNALSISRSQYGVTHMDDVFYLLPNEYIIETNTQNNDKQVANIYATLIINLVQTGTIQVGGWGTHGWQQYTPQNPSYLYFPRTATIPIAITANQPNNGYRTVYMDFFNDFIYELQGKTARYPKPFPKDEFDAYRVATWSLTGFVLLIILIVIAVIAILLVRRKRRHELKITRRNDREMLEKFNTT